MFVFSNAYLQKKILLTVSLLRLLRCTSNTTNSLLCVALHYLVLHHGKFADMKLNQSGRVYWHFLQFILQIENLHEGSPTRE
jgi:hypothetical protein